MKPDLRTLLRTLTRRSSEEDTQTTTYYIPAQPSPDNAPPPPRVQPRLPSSPFFHGRDHFTTNQLVRQRLDRSKRAILRKQVEQDPAYPDISPYAGYWGPSLTTFNSDFPALKLCENWRHESVAVLELEDLEDQARRDRMEKRIVRSLEPEFTRGVDKEEFARNMEMKFGWIAGHASMIGLAGGGRRSNRIVKEDEGPSSARKKLERPVIPRPSAESMVLAPGLDASTVSSVENYPLSEPYEQMSAVPKPLRVLKSNHHKTGKIENVQTQQERLQHAAAQKDFSPRRLILERDPFADKAYPRPSYSSPSVSTGFSSFRDAIRQGRQPEERKRSPKLFISREPEPPGPSLNSPFSWPEVVEGRSSSSSRKLVPPKPLSERSFQSISKQVEHMYNLRHPAAGKDVPLPQPSTGERDSGGFDIIERRQTVAVDARRQLSLENKIRASKERNERSRIAKEAAEAQKNQGLGSWLKKLW